MTNREQLKRWREENADAHNRHMWTENRRRYALAKARRIGSQHEVAALLAQDMEVQ